MVKNLTTEPFNFSLSISSSGTILGECIYTQNSTRFGGVIPSFAMGFHAEALPKALDSVIEQSSGVKCNGPENLRDRGIEAIAVTNKPGLSGSLSYVCEITLIQPLRPRKNFVRN